MVASYGRYEALHVEDLHSRKRSGAQRYISKQEILIGHFSLVDVVQSCRPRLISATASPMQCSRCIVAGHFPPADFDAGIMIVSLPYGKQRPAFDSDDALQSFYKAERAGSHRSFPSSAQENQRPRETFSE